MGDLRIFAFGAMIIAFAHVTSCGNNRSMDNRKLLQKVASELNTFQLPLEIDSLKLMEFIKMTNNNSGCVALYDSLSQAGKGLSYVSDTCHYENYYQYIEYVCGKINFIEGSDSYIMVLSANKKCMMGGEANKVYLVNLDKRNNVKSSYCLAYKKLVPSGKELKYSKIFENGSIESKSVGYYFNKDNGKGVSKQRTKDTLIERFK